jgi:hypothetical protein
MQMMQAQGHQPNDSAVFAYNAAANGPQVIPLQGINYYFTQYEASYYFCFCSGSRHLFPPNLIQIRSPHGVTQREAITILV